MQVHAHVQVPYKYNYAQICVCTLDNTPQIHIIKVTTSRIRMKSLLSVGHRLEAAHYYKTKQQSIKHGLNRWRAVDTN